MFPLRTAPLPLFPDPLLWTQLMFPIHPPRLPPPSDVKPPPEVIVRPPTPRLSATAHEKAPRQIGLKSVPEDTVTGGETAPGLLLLDLRVGGQRLVSVICIREQGFQVGNEIQIPDAWRKLCREEESGNVCETNVEKAIGVGEEIVLRPPDKKDSQDGSGFSCERCGKVFSYSYYRDKHLKYTRCVDNGDRKFPCPLCNRSFEKRDRLRIHVLHVHENHRPHCCAICGKAFSQSSSLNKHLRVHSGERPYSCPYCPKAFTASSILRTHIRQHSGEKPFKCAHCGKAFASHAAHDSHVRRTHLMATKTTD